MEGLWLFEAQIIRWVQGFGVWLQVPMDVASLMGTVEFYLLIMPALYWCWDNRLGVRLAAMLVLTVGTNEALKVAFHQPRPYWVLPAGEVQALSSEANFAFPSGHAQQAISLWGLLANGLRRRWVWAAVLVLVLLNGVSRMYLAVHWVSDVLAGWVVGAVLLWAFLRWEPSVTRWLRGRRLAQQVLLSLLASLALLGLSLLARASLGGWQVPLSWMENALARTGEPIAPLSLKNAVDVAGVLLGVGAGAAWMAQAGGFDTGGPALKRLVRYILGLLGLLALWFGLRALFPQGESFTTYALRYGRSALVGAWVSAGAPALFLRLGWAERHG